MRADSTSSFKCDFTAENDDEFYANYIKFSLTCLHLPFNQLKRILITSSSTLPILSKLVASSHHSKKRVSALERETFLDFFWLFQEIFLSTDDYDNSYAAYSHNALVFINDLRCATNAKCWFILKKTNEQIKKNKHKCG